jgi:hypothetical protein
MRPSAFERDPADPRGRVSRGAGQEDGAVGGLLPADQWQEAYGDRASLLAALGDPELRRLAEIHYGPWDRLDGDTPFIDGVGPKPAGAQFYPTDMTKEEFEASCAASPERAAALRSPYTLVRRDAHGGLVAVPYHVAFATELGRAAHKLRQAAELAEDPGLRRYLELRAVALLDDDYRASDLAWLDMKDNAIDIVIGPIEQYEDALFGYKAAHEGIVLLKDRAWSARLAKYAASRAAAPAPRARGVQAGNARR